jgi:16S rRNA processing protein RimM
MGISQDQCFYLGYISKVQGFKGGMIAFLDVDNPFDYKSLKSVLVDMNGVLQPFFIEQITIKDKSFAHLKIEGIDHRDDAVEISGKDLYLPLTALPSLPDDQYYLHELDGMEVVDEIHGPIGKVEKVLDYAQNALIQVLNQQHEVLIPLNDQFIARVDKKTRIVHVHIPKELLEINKI